MIAYFDHMLKAHKGYGKHLEPICKQWGLTRNELDVLLFLHNNPGLDRAADIVSRRGIAKSHVSLSVTALEARGLLERRLDPEDRRTVHLHLTEAAIPIAEQGKAVQRAYFSRLFEGLSREEVALWLSLVEKVCKNIDNLEEF